MVIVIVMKGSAHHTVILVVMVEVWTVDLLKSQVCKQSCRLISYDFERFSFSVIKEMWVIRAGIHKIANSAI